ncbi:hypothetical protein [Devosia sp.]|uniref:hypothetical protein n=1 Tax=Devosia sp. TaxID=1871048 RepID=UPI003A93F084
MRSGRFLKLCCGMLAVVVGSAGGISPGYADHFRADCAHPSITQFMRSEINNGTNKYGKPVKGYKLKLVGTMKELERDGANLVCRATLRITLKSGRSATRNARVNMVVRNGNIESLNFRILPGI